VIREAYDKLDYNTLDELDEWEQARRAAQGTGKFLGTVAMIGSIGTGTVATTGLESSQQATTGQLWSLESRVAQLTANGEQVAAAQLQRQLNQLRLQSVAVDPKLAEFGVRPSGGLGARSITTPLIEDVALKSRSIYQGGPYPAGRFGRGNALWQQDATYRSGQVRTERLIHQAGRAHGVDVHSLADEVIYVPGADNPFFATQSGNRVLALNQNAVFGSDESLRLLKAAHEVGHARVYNNPATFGGPLTYEAEEILVESLARQVVGPSNLSNRALQNSILYENFFRQLEGLPSLPLPP
jgi:hypothetical protein